MGQSIETPALYPELTARQNLQVQAANGGVSDHNLEELLQIINLSHTGKKKAKNFSLGMRQRLSIAGLSHDLRTPLTSINGYVQLLHETTDETKRAHYVKIIEQSVKRLMTMTDHFYDLARIETNQKEMALASLSLSIVVEEMFLSFYEQFTEQNIELQFPEDTQDRHIIADKFMLIRVLQNIAQNILRYAKSKVAVEKVFTRFYTEVSSRTNTEANGLGLYLSKKLIEKMNGDMDAELKGNWFILTIRLPINRNQVAGS